DEDDVLPGRVKHEHGLERRLGEPAEVAARAHRADEDALVEEVVGEADPVAEERARAERARGVDRDHPDRPPRRAQVADERADQARLADSRRPRYADDVRVARVRVEVADELAGERLAVLDERDRPCKRAPGARTGAL